LLTRTDNNYRIILAILQKSLATLNSHQRTFSTPIKIRLFYFQLKEKKSYPFKVLETGSSEKNLFDCPV